MSNDNVVDHTGSGPDPLDSPAYLRVVVGMLIKRLGVEVIVMTPADLIAVRGHTLCAGMTSDGPAIKLVPDDDVPRIIVPAH